MVKRQHLGKSYVLGTLSHDEMRRFMVTYGYKPETRPVAFWSGFAKSFSTFLVFDRSPAERCVNACVSFDSVSTAWQSTGDAIRHALNEGEIVAETPPATSDTTIPFPTTNRRDAKSSVGG